MFALGENALDQLRRALRALGLPIDAQRGTFRLPIQAPDDYFVVTPAAGIPLRSGLRIYSALCHVYRPVPVAGTNNEEYDLEPYHNPDGTIYTVRCFNISRTDAVGGSKLCATAREKWSGIRYVHWEDCEGTEYGYY